MELEVLTIGNELLLGYTLDTNAADLARATAAVGARIVRTTTVSDEPSVIEGAVREALHRTGFVITTGGLGPTRDDMTKRVVSGLFGARLVVDQIYLERLRERFERLLGRPMPETNRTQAEIPEGATVLTNRIGTAPGLWLAGELGTVVMLPGVPREMRVILEEELVPRLEREAQARGSLVIHSQLLRTTGVAESALAHDLEGVEARIAPVTLAYLPSTEGVDLRLTAWNMAQEAADRALKRAAATILPLLGRAYYGTDGTDLAAVLLNRLRATGQTLAVAESCTGGLIAARLTNHPGSSDVFVGGVTAYANEVKTKALGVDSVTLVEQGAVSEPVALQMALGVSQRFSTDAAIAVTGVAGPGGGSEDKPVGTVWLAARAGDQQRAVRRVFPGDRHDIRRRAAQAGLDLLRRMVAGTSD